MRAEGAQQGTDGDGRMTPMRGEYEENDDDDSWHGAREHGWETTAFGKLERLISELARSRKENRKASSEEERSEIGMTDSDGTRSGRGSVGQNGTAAQTDNRPERDPPHLVRRPRLFGRYGNVRPRRRKVVARGRGPRRTEAPGRANVASRRMCGPKRARKEFLGTGRQRRRSRRTPR
jgi:hypothetical protein